MKSFFAYGSPKVGKSEKPKTNLFFYGLWTILYGLLTLTATAQTNGPLTLSTTGTTGNYSSNVSITLSSPFSTTGPFTATIQSIDCIPLTTSPTQTSNYVITNTPRIAGITNSGQLAGLGTCALMQSIQYVDGLGRPIQNINVMASPFGYDMIQPQVYDQYGREVTKFLPYTPYAGTPGSFRPNALSGDQAAFYTNPPAGVTPIANPYAQINFDNSPLDRLVERGTPGAAWQLGGHTVKMVYTVNNATAFSADSINGRQVANYYTTINSDNSQTLHANSYYTAGTLTVSISKDENWVSGRAGTVEEYKDIDGHVVLKRVYNYTTADQVLSTYYVYDDLGRLAFVLPPASGADGAGTIVQATLDNLCYQYQYDERGRPVQKKLPGKGWEYTVFNTMDQPVATQDSLQRAAKNWIFTKYDSQQRAVISGIWNNGGTAVTRASLQGTLTSITTNLYEAAVNTGNGYTNVAWPTSNVTATLNTSYFDSYANIPGFPAAYSSPTGADLATRGQAVANKTAVLNTPTDQLWKVSYYDNWGRSLKAYAQHYLGGTSAYSTNNYDAIGSTYDFSNAPTTVTRQHFTSASTTTPLVTIANQYLYDHAGRKLKSWEQITNGTTATTRTLLSKIDYNEVGQVLTKHLHSTDSASYLQNITYNYNERGWLLGSTAPLFSMQLQYNTGTNKQYNGNIAYQYWQTTSLSDSYTYTYDKLNRLMGGVSGDNYKENGIAYDVMGNITALSRYQAGTLIDNLTYTYSSTNQLQNIVDNSGDAGTYGLVNGTTTYSYDGNGNLLSNANTVNAGQNKSFTYNLLNLPLVATSTLGVATFTYDATGNKLRKSSVTGGVTTTIDYISGIQYKNSTTAVDFIQTEEGRATPATSTTYDYTYYLSDNLGNTRVTFGTKTGATAIYQTDDYYPFGYEISRGSSVSPKNEYLYNKKELQEEFGEYDYGARFYDPVVARWNTIDPMAPKIGSISPYSFSFNNPLRFIDIDGMLPEEILTKHSRYDFNTQQISYYYTVNPGVASFLSGALGISRSAILNTSWNESGMVSLIGAQAITIGGNVYFSHAMADDNNVGSWVSFIGHESTHRSDVESQGGFSFYSNYLSDAMHNEYRDIPAEQKAFANGDQLDTFFQDARNVSDFNAILYNNKSSDKTKSNQLEALGIERIQIPGLEKLSSGLSQGLSDLSKDKSVSKDLLNAVKDIKKGIDGAIENNKKKVKDLRNSN